MLYFFERASPFALKVIAGLVVLSMVVPYAWCRYFTCGGEPSASP